ncbi:MAG TPA: universal stress protein [Pirellulales bacterium]|nr:universal stress protein [Pirellulales bacterium]
MPRTILVGLDGSPYSKAAVELGISWAKHWDAMLVGMGVIDEPSILQPEAVPVGAASAKKTQSDFLLADSRRKVEGLLEEFALRCANANVSCKLLEDVGSPAAQIVQEAQRYDMIMLGRRTYFRFETQTNQDETLHELIKLSPRPVVAVPDVSHRGEALVVAYDGSLQAARMLQAFCSLGFGKLGPLHIVSIHPDHLEAAKCADRAMDYLSFHKIRAQPHPIASYEPPAEVMLKQIEALNAGLLAMGAYGQTTIKEFLFGSMTRTILSEANAPVFLYH